MNRVCLNCSHWLKIEAPGSNQGQCRRFPPQIASESYYPGKDEAQEIRTLDQWPLTCSDDWCGEFKEAK